MTDQPLQESITRFFTAEKYQIVEVIKEGRIFVVDSAMHGSRVVVKIDPLNPEHRPGRPKGIARGDSYIAQQRMENIFKVMKDFRFFSLCLPAVFGMGRFEDYFDWVIYKYYEGKVYPWSEKNNQSTELGGAAISPENASEVAMLVFDLTQVPVLKFSQKVETKNYPEELASLTISGEVAVKAELISAEELNQALTRLGVFYDKKVPTLYTIQNGDFYPRNFLKLKESIVLLDWESAGITTVEEVVAYGHLLMWNNPEWQKLFLSELHNLLDLNEEWLRMMQLLVALKQVIFWSDTSEEEISSARAAMCAAFRAASTS